jgi:Xaa-Pro dipeptidase
MAANEETLGVLHPDDIDPGHIWDKAVPAPGHNNVDFEERDNNNIRYMTSTVIGEWSRDKMTRFSLLTGNGDPYVWDFGSAAVHHRLHAPWLKPDHCRAGLLGMRGMVPPSAGLMSGHAEEIKAILLEEGVADQPVGVDIIEPPMLRELERVGINVVDGQQLMLDAREVKSQDELILLNQAAAMVDGTYHMIQEELKPGVRESDIVALANKKLYELGSDDVEAINAISGERCSPHPHNFTDRIFRPGDQAFFDIIQSFNGYRTCYYRTFAVGRATPAQEDAYKKAREWIDLAIERVKPGTTTDQIAAVWPKAEDFGFANEMEAFGLQFGHGLGLNLHERPVISRLVSFDHPLEIKTGMVFALETYCPATDGMSAARIEEEVIVTDTGCRVITLYPAEELPITHRY